MNSEVRAIAETMATARNIPVAHLLAIIEVESRGRVFHTIKGQQYPLILFEPHLMYRMTEGRVRDALVAERLASKVWNKKLYPASQEARWGQVERAREIAGNIAYEPVSYGVGQVLGQHWRALDFDTMQSFLAMMFKGADGQIEIMLRYIERNDLEDELREGRWPAFFRGYNGPAWEKNGYGKLMDAALRKYGGAMREADGMLRMGSKGARVRELQALLVRAGYQVKVDSDFGTSTKTALKAFQQAKGLTVDGVAGPETETALGEYRQGAADKPGQPKLIEIKEVMQGTGGIGAGFVVDQLQNKVDAATAQLQAIDGLQPWIGYGLAALSVVALGLSAWGAWRAISGWLDSRKTVEV